MQTKPGITRTQDGQEWEFTMVLPSNIDEAMEAYGEKGVMYLVTATLVSKEQNIARAMFRQGKSREEVDRAVAAYKPGSGARRSVKDEAFKAILDNRDALEENPDLMGEVHKAFVNGQFSKVCELLGA